MAVIYKEIKRVTLSSSTFEEISFTKPNEKYLIKNLTSGDIYVSFESNATTENSSKIATGMYQICSTGIWEQAPWEKTGEFIDFRTTKIYIKGTGEVEIEQI